MLKEISETNKMDVLFVGAGPASLAGAIKLKQLLKENGRTESVVVIEKAGKIGNHNLSGAIFVADVLHDLIPDWENYKHPFITKMLANKVKKDDIVLLTTSQFATRIPRILTPRYMHNNGNYAISVSELVNFLSDVAKSTGVEIYTGFAAKNIIVEDGYVKGIKLGEKGLNKDGEKQPDYLAGENLRANVTVLGSGCLDPLVEQVINKFDLIKGKNHQVYSLGVKEIIRLPENNKFGTNRVIHTIGFPNRVLSPDVFGGGSLYSMGENLLAIALIMGLDWRYCDLNSQQELQIFKSHKFIKELIDGGEVVAYGAKTIPEGGYYSVPDLAANGCLLIGDAAGLVNIRKLKGLHYAIKSGIVAAKTIFSAIEKNSFSHDDLKRYNEDLSKSFVMKELRAARNYRQVFAKSGRLGIYAGTPLSLIQKYIPLKLKTNPDYESTRRSKLNRKFVVTIDRLTDVSLSRTNHREDQPSHITFSDGNNCKKCEADFGLQPCVFFCPGEVYRKENGDVKLSPSNCLHCKTCRVKCPSRNIIWELPEGGDGPKYKIM